MPSIADPIKGSSASVAHFQRGAKKIAQAKTKQTGIQEFKTMAAASSMFKTLGKPQVTEQQIRQFAIIPFNAILTLFPSWKDPIATA